MAFTVQNTIRRTNSQVFFDLDFRQALEQHLPTLRINPDTQRKTVSPDDVYRFEGDLYGYLHHENIPISQHWLIMRLNHYLSPTHFGKELHDPYVDSQHTTLLIPPELLIDQIKKQFLTKRTG